MLNHIISNLPFRPSLVEELGFYSKRLRKEQSIRLIGVVLIILSLLVQLLAVMIPPEKSLASSRNDVIGGGVRDLDHLIDEYGKRPAVRALYKRFGLDASDMTHAQASKVDFNFQYQGSQGTKTVGRVNFASTNDHNLGKFGGVTFYSRSASEWRGSSDAIYFGRQKGADGYFLVWVIKDCGNIAFRRVEGPEKTSTIREIGRTEGPTNWQPLPGVPPATTPLPKSETPPPPPPPEPEPEVPPEIERKKTALNMTQGLSYEQTIKSLAKAKDVIEYTLVTSTSNNQSKKNYTIEDNISDLLDYANVDMASVSSQGGTFSPENKTITWENQEVPAEGELRLSFKVILKETIPSTNSPNATAPEFDCRMQNGYGNEIIINIDCPVVKAVETLPNTGPGLAIILTFGITSFSSYFLARCRLLNREVFIIRKNYSANGDRK